MAKQNFLGLVKVTGSIANYSNITDKTGKLIFAQVTDGDVTKYIINANGIEYNIATAEVFQSLEARVQTLEGWKAIVDTSIANLVAKDAEIYSSISRLNSSVSSLEEWKAVVDVSVDAINASVSDLSTRMKVVEAFDSRIDSLETSMGIVESSINKLGTSVGGLLKSATLSAAATGNVATVQVDTLTDAGTPATSSVTVTGDDYVAVGQSANNALTLTTKLGDIATATADASGLATAYDVSAFVKEQIKNLEGALVFKGGVNSDESLPDDAAKGDVYVATSTWKSIEADSSIEAGDLIIRGDQKWIVVERNLDGAVTSGDKLASGYVVQGAGDQAVATSTVSLDSIVEVSTNAVRTVIAHSSTGDFLEAQAIKTGTTYDISYGVKTHEVATAADGANGLATALGVKEYVDAQAADIKVKAILNSSTPNYVDATASVDGTGRVITAGVGVKVATLEDASKGKDGLATAMDVYTELADVEQTMTAANSAMVNTIGLNSDYSVTWSTESGIAADTSIVKAIEQVAELAKQSGVTEFGGKKGAISIDTANVTDGSVKFAMDGSTLTGTVNGWSELKDRVAAAETSIGDVSNRVNEVSNSLNDLSTYVHQTVDASVNALETELAKHAVKSIEGEVGIAERANDEFVAVSATKDAEGKVTLDSSVQLATAIDLKDITGANAAKATGLATDATVKDYVAYALAWEVIGE